MKVILLSVLMVVAGAFLAECVTVPSLWTQEYVEIGMKGDKVYVTGPQEGNKFRGIMVHKDSSWDLIVTDGKTSVVYSLEWLWAGGKGRMQK